jgi:general secretion pathway protein D
MIACPRRLFASAFVLAATAALAQPRPPATPPITPPGTSPGQPSRPPLMPPAPGQPPRPQLGPPARQPGTAQAPATPPAGERQISPGGAQNGERVRPSCDEVKRRAKYGIYFDKVDLDKLVQTVADATCKTFILPENVRGKISIIGPENGKVEVNAEQFYAAFLSALDMNGLAVTPLGRFLKIVDKRSAKQTTIPLVLGPEEPYTTNEQMLTKLFRVKNVDIEPLRGILNQLVSKDGDCQPYPPDTLICNDTGANMHRLEQIIDQLDTRAATDEIRVIQIQFAAAQDVANTLQKIFEAKVNRPGSQRGGTAVMGGPPPGQPPQAREAAPEGPSGPATLSQIIPDERTNKLIVVASPAAWDRIFQLVREIDIPISGEGRINVHYLENANAEDLASTLQNLTQGVSGGRSRAAPVPPGVQRPGSAPTGAVTAELFSGEVKISADKATNSLVIIASQADYRNLVRVIEKLDIPRRQVFVEAVIMEVNLDRNAAYGLEFHQGIPLSTSEGTIPALVGTNYARSSLPPSFSLQSLASMGGFLAGLQGPVIPALQKLGVNIPAFGIVLHALQQSSDVNVLSTPHLLTSDNEEAEITVGQNVPFQAGFNPSGLGSLLGQQTTGGVNPALFSGGLSSLYAPINRQNVELKLTVKPQINESQMIRLVISEQTEEIASQDPVLGPTTSKRSAKTTIVARNQETVVIGGIMQDRTIESVNKVPILGDMPIVGHLFRDTTRRKVKTNLLLFLTPYIINSQADFQAIFERKMAERQAFVEQFYGAVPSYEATVDWSRKAGPLARMNQAVMREERKIENGGPGNPGDQVIGPQPAPGPVAPSKPPEGGQGPTVEPPDSAQPPDQPPPEREGDEEPLKVRPPPSDYNEE